VFQGIREEYGIARESSQSRKPTGRKHKKAGKGVCKGVGTNSMNRSEEGKVRGFTGVQWLQVEIV